MRTDHTSKDYDQALERARELVGLMSVRVERQLDDAIESLHSGSAALIAQILRHEADVNGLERSIDEFTGATSPRKSRCMRAASFPPAARCCRASSSCGRWRRWCAATSRRTRAGAVLARLAGFMVEDPRTISACLDILFVAKSFERIGDHAKNVGEHVVYAAMGKDVRHATAQEIEQVVRR